MDIAKIGEFIKAQRTAQGMTQKDLAEKIGCTDKAVSRWETGKGLPDMSFIIPLSEELHVSVNELLRGERLFPAQAPPEEVQIVTEIIKKNDETLISVMEEKEKAVRRHTKFSLGLLILFCLQMVTFFIIPGILPHQWSSAETMLILTAIISVCAGFSKSRFKWLFPVAMVLMFFIINLLHRTEEGFLGFVLSLYFAAGSAVIILLCSAVKLVLGKVWAKK